MDNYSIIVTNTLRQEISCILSNFNSYINCIQNSSYIYLVILLILTYWTFTSVDDIVFKVPIKTIIIIIIILISGDSNDKGYGGHVGVHNKIM